MRSIIRRRVAKLLAALGVCAAALTEGTPVEASGGIGWLAQMDIDATSISISWGLGSKFTPADRSPFPYTVCWKTSGDIEGACHGGETTTTDRTHFTITGLSPDKKYKIKVLCDCEKNGKNVKARKVGTLTVTTPLAFQSPLVVTGVHTDGFDVEYMFPGSPRPHLRLLYKMAWSARFFMNKCAAETAEGDNSDAASGSYDLPATWGTFSTRVPLRPHTRYRLALCDTTNDILLAEVKINTARQ